MAKLFIVGFPRDINEITLVEIFSAHGSVETVTIVTDRETGISKGYGFISMSDEAGAERAIQGLDGTTMGDRQINVRIADDKRDVQPAYKPFQKSATAIFPQRRPPENNPPVKKKRPRL